MIVTRTYTIKLKPNSSQRKQLHQYFYEAKVLYNYLLSCSNIFTVTSCKIKHPWKYDKDKNKVKVELISLPSKLKQNVHRQILDSIKSLSASKKKGYAVGKLKFKSEIKTIELDNQCYSIEDSNHVKIAGFGRKKICARGLHQFSNVIKFRNAKLMKKDDEFFLKICVSKEIMLHEYSGNSVGIDMGIETTATLSTGEKFNCKIEETVRLKRLQRKLARSQIINGKKRTNNQKKIIRQLHKEYQKISNQKKDSMNKLLKYLDSFDNIIFQDESIRGWRNLQGNKRTIQHSMLGSFKQKLIEKSHEQPERYRMLSKWEPTTQLCPQCGSLNKHGLEERIYTCSCGYSEDRDIHAAKNMLVFAEIASA